MVSFFFTIILGILFLATVIGIAEYQQYEQPKRHAANDTRRKVKDKPSYMTEIAAMMDEIDTQIAQLEALEDSHTNTPKTTKTTPVAENTTTYAETKTRLDTVQMRYANAHLHRGREARYIFDAPAIFDVTVPATASYLDAVEEAKTCFVGITNLNTPADTRTIRAVDAAEEAWDDMVDFAQRNITTAMDRPTRDRVSRLINLVSHSSTDNAEAELARDKLVDILSGITYAVPMVGGGNREIQLNADYMFDPTQMRNMLTLGHREPPQLENKPGYFEVAQQRLSAQQ